MLKRVYYYTYSDTDVEFQPFRKVNLSEYIKECLGLENLTGMELPNDIATNNVYNELFANILGRFRHHPIIKIEKYCTEVEPISEEINAGRNDWLYNVIGVLNATYKYYTTLLAEYSANASNLMADITATSKNKIKYNDTPQNANTAGVYEGDNYITNFTATEGETSSPLMSKIMRLKEIQEHYKNLMNDWTKEFERTFFMEVC